MPSASEIDAAYEAAQKFIAASSDKDSTLSNTQKLQFYALYKQATQGPCTGKRSHSFVNCEGPSVSPTVVTDCVRQATWPFANGGSGQVRRLESARQDEPTRCQARLRQAPRQESAQVRPQTLSSPDSPQLISKRVHLLSMECS